jgi:hypothetical protein
MAETRSTETDVANPITTSEVVANPAGMPISRPLDPGSQPPPPPVSDGEPENLDALDAEIDRKELEPGIGLEGEFVVWEGRLSLKNFVGRFVLRVLASVGWIVLAYFAYGRGEVEAFWNPLAIVAGIAVLAFWLQLGWRVFYARAGHFYRLTNKRLFVWSGVFRRRVDQLELLNVDDVFVQHKSLFARMLHVGTVVIEASEERSPLTYLVGVDEPEKVMDTVWHTSRAEREGHTVRVDRV